MIRIKGKDGEEIMKKEEQQEEESLSTEVEERNRREIREKGNKARCEK